MRLKDDLFIQKNTCMNVPANLKYTRDHEWVLVEGNTATVGITEFAQKQLGDIVFVEIPTIGKQITRGNDFGTIESVKSVSELFIPLTGKINTLNEDLIDSPDLINEDPYGEGWLIKMSIDKKDELKELLSPDAYKKLIEAQ
ncbi:glycine cleavage system protein GcvH [Paraflavitalea speifideaquila]|uniref:glycine cleavage system protein GcvH n=1 Tax=Paraflavitalea speifideaquila TaxID=3076558 RepID=UPI0028ECA29D|nr:glycine cleavage system protein GcvH [Paraflavitalea speifideiaquila]